MVVAYPAKNKKGKACQHKYILSYLNHFKQSIYIRSFCIFLSKKSTTKTGQNRFEIESPCSRAGWLELLQKCYLSKAIWRSSNILLIRAIWRGTNGWLIKIPRQSTTEKSNSPVILELFLQEHEHISASHHRKSSRFFLCQSQATASRLIKKPSQRKTWSNIPNLIATSIMLQLVIIDQDKWKKENVQTMYYIMAVLWTMHNRHVPP